MSISKVKLLAHASILIEADGKRILTDPWFFGTAFNDGWELSPKPSLEDIKSDIKDIDIIWISHEHPDHLHFPTLKWIAEFIEKDVEIYFQENNSFKVFGALKKLGYQSFVSMPHLSKIPITSNVKLACYAHRHLDSSLAVFIKDNFWLLDVNDTELNENDIKIIKNEFGKPTVLYNQFSIAGSNGIETSLRSDSVTVLDKMRQHHKSLSAKISVPIASFVRFSRYDNAYMNDYVNTVFDAKNIFQESNLQLVLQKIGGDYLEWEDINEVPLNLLEIDADGQSFFANEIVTEDDTYDYKVIAQKEVKKVIEDRVSDWQKVTNKIVLKFLKLKPVFFRVVDWDNEIWKVDFLKNTFSKACGTNEFDISIASQPLWQAFKTPFGIQTLGVSGRYKLAQEFDCVPKKWKKIRILSSLYNAEIYLSISGLFSRQMFLWLWARRKGMISQILQQLRRFQRN
tara:strand:+ start:222 stop:1589 length:1368 start_codon:yes stop_codon:yes gene_type:complete